MAASYCSRTLTTFLDWGGRYRDIRENISLVLIVTGKFEVSGNNKMIGELIYYRGIIRQYCLWFCCGIRVDTVPLNRHDTTIGTNATA